MSHEWLLSQLLLSYPGGAEAIVTTLGVPHLSVQHPFDMIPDKDLLTLILSYVCRTDIKNVMLTCKRFYHATQQESFWNRNVNCFLLEHMKDKRLVVQFDTFGIVARETLRQQVEFIFRKNKWFCKLSFKFSADSVLWVRQSHNGYLLVMEYFENNFELHSKHYYKGSIGMPRHVMVETWSCDANNLIHYQSIMYDNRGDIDWNNEQNSIMHEFGVDCIVSRWKGGCCKVKSQATPHGSGEWTFRDGTVLKGEGVAFRGEIVFPYSLFKEEELEPLMKRLKK